MGVLCTGLEIVLRLKLFQNLKKLPKRDIKNDSDGFFFCNTTYSIHPKINSKKCIKQEAFDLYNLFY